MTSPKSGAARKNAACNLVVHPDCVLRTGADRFIGINLNYIRDHDKNRMRGARPIKDALRDMGVRWLRFPGGEKSDFHLWSTPPYKKPHPLSRGNYADMPGCRMNFDEYVKLAHALKCEPYVVAAYDSLDRTKMSKSQLIEMAVAWVRYSNIIKKYGVRYWEIGNENWHNGTSTPKEMAGIVVEFSKAMKAVDPSILIGASGCNNEWWKEFLPVAAKHIDFLTLSLYNTTNWGSYGYYPKHPGAPLLATANCAVESIDKYAQKTHRKRLRIIVAEMNSKDFNKTKKAWPGFNNLGHAIVTCDTFGQALLEPRIISTMLWTTRWMPEGEERKSQWYALDGKNNFCAAGFAVAVWGKFVRERMVRITGMPDTISAYASMNGAGTEFCAIIINKGYAPINNIRIILKPCGSFAKVRHFRLSGKGSEDCNPQLLQLPNVNVANGMIAGFSLPGVSVTVLVSGRKKN